MTEVDPHASTPTEEPRSWQTAVVTVAVPLFIIGWFLLEWRVMGETAGDAVGEALGAGLGLLVALSVVGAVRNARRARQQLDEDASGSET